ncbi:hypothetical protein MBLNU457_1296t2 [Dothideomycetes sp. NU457]
MWDQLPSEYQSMQIQLFNGLQSRLRDAVIGLERIVGPLPPDGRPLKAVQKMKYVVLSSKLDVLLVDIARWADVFDPSWYLLARKDEAHQVFAQVQDTCDASYSVPPSPTLAKTMARQLTANVEGPSSKNGSVFMPHADTANFHPIPNSDAKRTTYEGVHFIIDRRISASPINSTSTLEDVRRLARALQKQDPATSGILKCRGVIKTESSSAPTMHFDFVFNYPSKDSEPCGFRKALLQPSQHALEARLDIARSLARSIAYLHTMKFVHKNINPESLILFGYEQGSSRVLGTAYLVGFEQFRSADAATLQAGDDSWIKNLYRHPSRQGIHPDDQYRMQHDIYSLGVCLLEIGLWTSLVTAEGNPSQDIGDQVLAKTTETEKAKEIKKVLTTMAQRLPFTIGTKYHDVVLSCLTCMDEKNIDFGTEDDLLDDDGMVIGTRYIETVLMKLNEIVL